MTVASVNSNKKAKLSATNRTSRVVELFWIGFDGSESAFGRVGVGEEWSVSTFATHVWRVKYEDGTEVSDTHPTPI